MSSGPPETIFAQWTDPTGATRVHYSLPTFHEIDFQVNEGYRRIPHGGVEIGGVLYGRLTGSSLNLEAFRPILCEHASGPSFVLSDRDLVNLRASIQTASQEEELQGLVPLGWFIAHTRSPLRLSDRELKLFDQFFPEPGRVTVLVKPERFKPTRFSFLVRNASRRVPVDGEEIAVILPLPGRASKAPIAEAAVPAASVSPRPEPLPETLVAVEPAPFSAPVPPPENAPIAQSLGVTKPGPYSPPRPVRSSFRPNWMMLILVLAALIGCAGGYWAYLQLPTPVISLRLQRSGDNLLVFWDPTQTRDSRFPAIRLNDGSPVLLTEEQRETGTAEIPISPDGVKIELIAPHWARDSRGILRFVNLGRVVDQR